MILMKVHIIVARDDSLRPNTILKAEKKRKGEDTYIGVREVVSDGRCFTS